METRGVQTKIAWTVQARAGQAVEGGRGESCGSFIVSGGPAQALAHAHWFAARISSQAVRRPRAFVPQPGSSHALFVCGGLRLGRFGGGGRNRHRAGRARKNSGGTLRGRIGEGIEKAAG